MEALEFTARPQPAKARRAGELQAQADGGDARLARKLRADAAAERKIGEDRERADVRLAARVRAPAARGDGQPDALATDAVERPIEEDARDVKAGLAIH